MSKEYTIDCLVCNGTGKISTNWLAFRRKELNLTQDDVAQSLGILRTQVSNIERGVSILTSDKILKYASLLEVNVDELLKNLYGWES